MTNTVSRFLVLSTFLGALVSCTLDPPLPQMVLAAPIDQVALGSSVSLTASVSDGTADPGFVTWTSSDPTIATVDQNGLVKSLGLGLLTITATPSVVSVLAGSKSLSVGIKDDFSSVGPWGSYVVGGVYQRTVTSLYVAGPTVKSPYVGNGATKVVLKAPYSYSIDFRFSTGTVASGVRPTIALAFNNDSVGSLDEVNIKSTGTFAILHFEKYTATSPPETQATGFKGAGEWNTLKIEQGLSSFKVLLNGFDLGTYTNTPPAAGGYFDFLSGNEGAVAASVTTEFDNLSLFPTIAQP